MHALSEDLLHWSLLFCLYSIALNCLILKSDKLSCCAFLHLPADFVPYTPFSFFPPEEPKAKYLSSQCREWMFKTCKEFSWRGRFWNVFGYCTEEGRSETTAVSGWLGGQAHLPLHQPCVAWKHRAWLSFLMLSGALGGKEEALQLPISLECQHGQGSPAITHLFTDSQKVCFLRESFWFWEKSVHVMQQLLSSEGTTL